jgi:hypothetical protein
VERFFYAQTRRNNVATRLIKRDGQTYKFTTGKAGSTVSTEKMPMTPMTVPMQQKAKTIIDPALKKKSKVSPDVMKARQRLAPILVGSTRG